MTHLALLLLDIPDTAVVSRLLLNVGTHFFVAIEAQIVLIILIERGMTFLALVFVFGVPFDYFAGHHGAIKRAKRPGVTDDRQ